MTRVVQPLRRYVMPVQPNSYSLGEFRELAKSRIASQPEITMDIVREARDLPTQPGKSELVRKLLTIHRMRSMVPEPAWPQFVKRALRRAGSTFDPFGNFDSSLPD